MTVKLSGDAPTTQHNELGATPYVPALNNTYTPKILSMIHNSRFQNVINTFIKEKKNKPAQLQYMTYMTAIIAQNVDTRLMNH